MTEQEAIKSLKEMFPKGLCEKDEYEMSQKAIKTLEEVEQYRAIGTVEELKESKEQYDNINCAAKSIQLSGLCDFENAKGKIISEIKRNYEYSLMDYETIGTPEECRAAVEKQIPKKITHPGCFDNEGVWHTWNGIDGVPYDLCPNCETNLCTDGVFGRDKKKMKYCENCGQKLDWGDEK